VTVFDYIRGSLARKSPADVVIEAGGVGYSLIIPLSTYEKLPPPDAEVKLLCHHHVREDTQKLYGFFTAVERDIFRTLIGISNIGPKTAINILSGITPRELISCVNKGDSSRLRKVPGVGDKTAQRLIVELKGKLAPASASVEADTEGAGGAEPKMLTEDRSQAYAAMLSLGYSEKQVQTAFSRVESVIAEGAPVEEWIKKALQVI
jgi:Holliday junction DNA helicase RuvA